MLYASGVPCPGRPGWISARASFQLNTSVGKDFPCCLRRHRRDAKATYAKVWGFSLISPHSKYVDKRKNRRMKVHMGHALSPPSFANLEPALAGLEEDKAASSRKEDPSETDYRIQQRMKPPRQRRGGLRRPNRKVT